MLILGIDIGSRSIEIVGLDKGELQLKKQLPTTFDPLAQLRKGLKDLAFAGVVATGYGRGLVDRLDLKVPVKKITEIKAYAKGVSALFPQARSILDIGGQDTKALLLNEQGGLLKFEMNDRCAAGTGKFLEQMANIFQIGIEEFGPYALKGDRVPVINSMCTVFAETEATSLMAQGEKPENIALALHHAIVKRCVNMLKRVGATPPLIFAGGVAHNPCVAQLLSENLGFSPIIPQDPDFIGAIGAALSFS
ncbi:MAG: (R)-2-hydroxyacyl-CoA dehydratese activating ATPase [Desulfonauticus sp.]|jgi:predicted CoA-substrate-specific enzyme activase|nr:MAG: CoA-substrate-specific enzyme activase [Desulfonauticus sp. 38_4375]MDK2922097.1 (R)-2-hydroxyacyl-CoA dehydratese activating ATPase [Desulfonauticus sp.]